MKVATQRQFGKPPSDAWLLSQPAFTYSNSRIEIREQCMKSVQRHQNNESMTSFWCLYCSLSTYLKHRSRVSTVGFEQVNGGAFI